MSTPSISIHGLSKNYGRTVALQNLDLQIPEGAIFGLLGPNGAGKSTTFGLLCGWLRPTRGDATVLGVRPADVHRLRGQVAALPQDALFPAQVSVGEQLTHFARLQGMGPAKAKNEAERVLDAVDLPQVASMRGNQLSHGMRKRVGLAQCLIGEPRLIFLDEPTAGIDPQNARRIKDLIAAQAPRATVVVSSHNLVDIQEICTHGAILDHGRLVKAGSIAELTRRGAEISIEYADGAAIPWERLHELFGADNVDNPSHTFLRIHFDAQRDASEVIAEALRALLEKEVPILGVSRGTSLEQAYLAAVEQTPP